MNASKLVSTTCSVSAWMLAFGVAGSMLVLTFSFLLTSIAAAAIVGVLAICTLVLLHRGAGEWRIEHVHLRALSQLLMLSMIVHSGRPMHVALCAGSFLVLNSVPRTWLRPTAALIATALGAMAGFLPPSLFESYGPSSELAFAYRLGCVLVVVPLLLFACFTEERERR